MAATAHPVAGLDVPGNDAMDLHSDTEPVSHDEDIDFDLDPPADVYPQGDDDVSLKDAGTDRAVDLSTTFGDLDDFMVDKEDIIEEDEIDFDDRQLGHATLPNAANPEGSSRNEEIPTTTFNLDSNPEAQPDLDAELIEYSDDESDDKNQAVPDQQTSNEKVNSQGDNVSAVPDEAAEHAEPSLQDGDNGFEYEEHTEEADDQTEIQPWRETDNVAWDEQGDIEYEGSLHADDGSNNMVEQPVGDSDDVTKGDENQPKAPQPRNATDNNLAADDALAFENLDNGSSDFPHLPPVTINYDGSEFWLFKPQNEEDGEWLLDDESVATQPITHLFSACRAQLGDDISSETELGFRFDHFHALELYQDSTACAVSNLKDFLDLYIALHAQDGNDDPESFYITLQFRPRVISLIGDLQKAVQEQVGFTGLNTAIAAGHTNFNSSCMGNYTQQLVEQWDNDEHVDNREIDEEVNEQQDNLSVDEDGSIPQSNENSPDVSPGNDSAGDVAHQSGISSEDDTPDVQPVRPSYESPSNPIVDSASADESNEFEDVDEEYDADDVLEYSDDEKPQNVHHTGNNSVQGPSSGSSTVQGDNTLSAFTGAEDVTNLSVPHDDNSQAGEDIDEGLSHDLLSTGRTDAYGQYDENANLEDVNYAGDEYERAYEQELSRLSQENNTGDLATGEYSTADGNQDDGDYYYEGATTLLGDNNEFDIDKAYEDTYEDADGYNAPLDSAAQATADDDLATAEELLDFSGVAEDPDDAGEDAPAGGSGAVSLAASPDTTSSAKYQDGSSQRQKRPIDQVDAGQDVASILTDAKRPKL